MSSSLGSPTALPCARSSQRTPGTHSRSSVGVDAIETASASSPAPRPTPSITTRTTGPLGNCFACGRNGDGMTPAPYHSVAIAVLGRLEPELLERVVDLLARLLTELGGQRHVAAGGAHELRVILALELQLGLAIRE